MRVSVFGGFVRACVFGSGGRWRERGVFFFLLLQVGVSNERGIWSREREPRPNLPLFRFFFFFCIPPLFCLLFSRVSLLLPLCSFPPLPPSRRAAGCRTWPTRSGQCRPPTGWRGRRHSLVPGSFDALRGDDFFRGRDLNRRRFFLAFTARGWPAAAGGEQRPVAEAQPRRWESKERARERKKGGREREGVTSLLEIVREEIVFLFPLDSFCTLFLSSFSRSTPPPKTARPSTPGPAAAA